MSRLDILLKRFNHIKRMWLNSLEGSDEQKLLENQMEICLKDIKSCKARKGSSELGSSVMSKYISLNEKQAQKNTDKQEKED